MNKQRDIEEDKEYVRALVAGLFRTALVNFMEDKRDLHGKMKELGLEKQTSLKD